MVKDAKHELHASFSKRHDAVGGRYFPRSVFQHLVAYAKCCWRDLQRLVVDALRDAFLDMATLEDITNLALQ